MATDTTPKDDRKPAKTTTEHTAKSAKKLDAEAKRRAKERVKATDELKDGLAATAHAAEHTAEVLAADVKAGATRATTTVKSRSAEAALAGGRMVTRVPKTAWTVAIGTIAAGGILVKWLSSRRAKDRET